MTTSIQKILAQHDPDVLMDRPTSNEAKLVVQNLAQAELYPEHMNPNQAAREQYVQDETEYLKELNNTLNEEYTVEELIECLESNPDFEPFADDQHYELPEQE